MVDAPHCLVVKNPLRLRQRKARTVDGEAFRGRPRLPAQMSRRRGKLWIVFDLVIPDLPPDRVYCRNLDVPVCLEVVSVQLNESGCVLLAAKMHGVFHAVPGTPFRLRTKEI